MLVDDLLEVVAIYTTLAATRRLVSFGPRMAYKDSLWRRKLLYERKGVVTNNDHAYSLYVETTRRFGGVLWEALNDAPQYTLSYEGVVLHAAVRDPLACLVTVDGRVAMRRASSSYINWTPIELPERITFVVVECEDHLGESDVFAVGESSTIYRLHDGGNAIERYTLGIGEIVDMVSARGGDDLYILNREGTVYEVRAPSVRVVRRNAHTIAPLRGEEHKRTAPPYRPLPLPECTVYALYGDDAYEGLLVDVGRGDYQQPAGSKPVGLLGVSPLSTLWGGTVYYALPAAARPPSLMPATLTGAIMDDTPNAQPEDVRDTARLMDQNYTEAVADIENETGEDAGLLNRWGRF